MPAKKIIKVVTDEVLELPMPTAMQKTISGTSYGISPKVGMTIACVCGRSFNIAKDTLIEIFNSIEDATPGTIAKVRNKSIKYNDLPGGSIFFVKDNKNGHNYQVNAPIMKINNQYAMDISKQYPDGFKFGNVPPPEVYQILAVNTIFLKIIPEQFLPLFKVEEL